MRDVALPKCRIEQLPQVVLPIKQAKRQSTAGEVILKKPELELRGVWEQVPGVQALHTTEQEELPIGRPKAGRCSGGRPLFPRSSRSFRSFPHFFIDYDQKNFHNRSFFYTQR